MYVDPKADFDWTVFFYLSYITLTTFSIILGIFVLYTRLYDFRITAHIIQVRRRILKKYRERLPLKEYNEIGVSDRIGNFLYIIFVKIKFIKTSDIKSFMSAKESFLTKFNELRKIKSVLGNATLRWTKLQGSVLLFGIVIFVVYLVV